MSCIYISNNIKMDWQCEHGHVWQASPGKIMRGTWCPYCIGRGKTIEDMHKLAHKKNGECLSVKYIRDEYKST